jgi:hypothetical protein
MLASGSEGLVRLKVGIPSSSFSDSPVGSEGRDHTD